MKFYRMKRIPEKRPIKAIRLDKAFINEKVPGVVALEHGRKPGREHWNGVRLQRMKLWTYPVINDLEWFTYRKNSDKIKRVTLREYLKRKEKKR